MAFDFLESWGEFFFFVLLVIGFLLAAASTSAALTYLTILASGFMAGRLLFERKGKLQFPYVIIIIGFIFGFIIGSFYGNRFVTLVLFLVGMAVGYQLLNKGIIKDIRF